MKKYIINIALALAAAGLWSCDDALDLTSKEKPAEGQYFYKAEDLMLFTNPLYNNLLPKEPFKDQSDHFVQANLSKELLGGSFRTVPAKTSGSGWTWTNLRRINDLLERVDRCSDKDAVTLYTAVARFFRAYFYFDKVMRFGDVPWFDTPVGSADNDLLYKDRESREKIMTEMLKDIDFAIKELPDHKAQTNVPYRVTNWAALALKSRFCLFEGTYRKYHGITLDGHDGNYYLDLAAKAAKELMDNGPYKIYKTGKPESDYRNLFIAEKANTDEYILAISFAKGTSAYHDAWGFASQASRGIPGFTRKFINTYLYIDEEDGKAKPFTDILGWQEKRIDEEMVHRDPRLAQTIRPLSGLTIDGKPCTPNLSLSTTGYNITKFVPDGVGAADKSTNDIPVFRYAEVLLNYAEARAELGQLTPDDVDATINEIRDRVGMPHLDMTAANLNPDYYLSSEEFGYTNVTGSNKGVILEIRRERGIELAAEGFRWADIRRWKAGACYDQALTGMYVPGPCSIDYDGDGKPDLVFYMKGESKPDIKDAQIYSIGGDVILTEGNYGYVNYHHSVTRYKFNELRDYLYPIPSDQISLYRDRGYEITQNPNWGNE